MSYAELLDRKAQCGERLRLRAASGMPDFLFDFQRALVEWAVRKGRAAIFADCGLGKTPMQLVWAENVVRHTNRPRADPDAARGVAADDARGGEVRHRGARARRTGESPAPASSSPTTSGCTSSTRADFAGVVCDESSILKSFDGVRRRRVTEFMREAALSAALHGDRGAERLHRARHVSARRSAYLGYMDMLDAVLQQRPEQRRATNGR